MSLQFTRKQQAYSLLSTLLISAIPILPSSAVAQQACVMTKAGKKVCGTLILTETLNSPAVTPARSNRSTGSKSPGSTVILDYPGDVKISVQLEKCAEYVNEVNCTLTVTKIQGENDNKGAVFASFKSVETGPIESEAIDDKDRSYTATKIKARIIDSSEQAIILFFTKNRRIPVTLVFKIPDDVKSIKKLTFPVIYGKSDPKVATFSNINIGR
jgi:hypothetical protein